MWHFLQIDSEPRILGPIIQFSSGHATAAWSPSSLTLLLTIIGAVMIGLILIQLGLLWLPIDSQFEAASTSRDPAQPHPHAPPPGRATEAPPRTD